MHRSLIIRSHDNFSNHYSLPITFITNLIPRPSMASFVKQKRQHAFVRDTPTHEHHHHKPHKKHRRHKKPKKKKSKFLKFLFWAGIIILLYLYYSPIKNQAINILQLNPTIWSIYLAINAEITAKTLLGLFLTSFFGALFFISLPIELVFLYYLTLEFNPLAVFLIALTGNSFGMLFNYFFGYLLGPNLLRKWLKEKYESWRKLLIKSGPFLLIFGNIVPFPIEPIAVFIGGVRYPFTKFLIYTFLGKLIKFTLLYVGYVYLSESLTDFWQTLLWPWLLHMYESYIVPVGL